MSLHVHRAERTDLLADELATLLATTPADPFTPDLVAVPTKGVERFLAQRLALTLGTQGQGDGVCANVLFPSPAALLHTVTTRAAGRDPDLDPWRAAELPWRIAEVIGEVLDEPWALPIRVYLRNDPSPAEAAGHAGANAVPLAGGADIAGRSETADTLAPACEPESADSSQDPPRRPAAPCPPTPDELFAEPPAGEADRPASRSAPDRWRGSGRVMALSGRLAELFSSYDLERPATVTAWAEEVPADVPDDLMWQFRLWRAVWQSVGVPSLGEELQRACDRLLDQPDIVALPERISVFGPTRLPLAHVSVLRALGEYRDVHLWLPDPSPQRWRRIVDLTESDGRSSGHELPRDRNRGLTSADRGTEPPRPLSRPRRRDLPLPADHPLLRSLGRDSAELAYQLGSLDAAGSQPGAASPPRPDCLLGWLQTDLAADRVPTDDERAGRRLRPDDTSLRIHACHGRPRQVEVLREVLLGLLQRDPTLEPRDILVMCPDVATFAPLITAAFGVEDTRGGSRNPARDLRVRIADRTPEQLNPVLAALDELLTLAVGRFPAAAVFDFAALPVVSHRFGWDTEQLDRIRVLADAAGVRWGLDWEDRRRFSLVTGQNTWTAGIDRLLLGVAMAEGGTEAIGRTLPLDDVGDSDIAAVGQLAELVDRLRILAPELRRRHTAAQWYELLTRALTQLTSLPPWDQGLFPAALGGIGQLLAIDEGDRPGADVLLELGDVRHLLKSLLAGRPTRTNFRTGGLTVCSLVPMRSVPHRVVCLLGIDDGVYPRATRVDGNDVLGREPRVGEPDAGASDRQVLLDAIMAATETLVVVHTGADQQTNTGQPPSVPVQELIDAVAMTASPPDSSAWVGPVETTPSDEPVETALSDEPVETTPSDEPVQAMAHPGVADLVVTRHPLQPFDPANFAPGPAGAGQPFSHDRHALAGAEALAGPRGAVPALVAGRLPDEPGAEVTLADLMRFCSEPAAHYLRRRMGLRFRGTDELPDDEMPVDLAGLQRYGVGQRMLEQLLAGVEPAAAWHAECLRGTVPPGRLSSQACDDILPQAQRIASFAQPWREGPAREIGVDLRLPSGVRVTGVVSDVHGEAAVNVTFAKMKEKYHLHAWLQVLALQATRPDSAATACYLTHSDDGQCGVEVAPPDDPLATLDQIVDLYLRGMREPLPLTPRSGSRYTRLRNSRTAVDEALAKIGKDLWDPDPYSRTNDACEEAHMAIWGTTDPFAEFTAACPEADERTWFPDEPTRFGVLARRLWTPLLPCLKEVG